MTTQHFLTNIGNPGERVIVSNIPITVCGVSGQRHESGYYFVKVTPAMGTMLSATTEAHYAQIGYVEAPAAPPL